MSEDLTSQYDTSKQLSTSSAYDSSTGLASMQSPAYSISTGDDVNASGDNKLDLHDPKVAKSEHDRLSSMGNLPRSKADLHHYGYYHPTFKPLHCGGYTYWVDQHSMEPLYIGADNSNSYFYYDRAFNGSLVQFINNMEDKNEKDRNKYIIWKDMEVKGGYRFLEGTWFWQDDKVEVGVNQFGISKSLSSNEIEISFPGPSLGTISVDLTQPYFGIKANAKPSFNAGIFGFEFDAESKELGISMGISKGNFGLEVKFVGQVNTDKTSEDAQEYIAYDLLPWVGEIKDAL